MVHKNNILLNFLKNKKNFAKTIAKLKKLYYNLHEVEKSGTKW